LLGIGLHLRNFAPHKCRHRYRVTITHVTDKHVTGKLNHVTQAKICPKPGHAARTDSAKSICRDQRPFVPVRSQPIEDLRDASRSATGSATLRSDSELQVATMQAGMDVSIFQTIAVLGALDHRVRVEYAYASQFRRTPKLTPSPCSPAPIRSSRCPNQSVTPVAPADPTSGLVAPMRCARCQALERRENLMPVSA